MLQPIIQSASYRPVDWSVQSPSSKKLWMACQAALEKTLKRPMPTYARLANFTFPSACAPTARPEIAAFVKARARSSYSALQERAALDTWSATAPRRAALGNVHQLAQQIFQLLMGRSEALRTVPLSIVYLPWLRLAPLQSGDALLWYTPNEDEPWLFRALQAFLVLITAHPFSDGNGRVARIVFNAYARDACGGSYLPLADVLRGSEGIYEEMLALAAVDGRYDELLRYVLKLFAAYAEYICEDEFAVEEVDEFHAAVELAAAEGGGNTPFFVSNARPYVISYRWLFQSLREPRNRRLASALAEIVSDLRPVAEIRYAIVSLAHLQHQPLGVDLPLLLVVKTADVDGLLIKSRAVKTRHMDTVTLRIALETDDVVANTRLVLGFCLASFNSVNRDVTIIRDIGDENQVDHAALADSARPQ